MSKISIACPQDAVAIDRGRMREVARAVLDGEGVADYEISLAVGPRWSTDGQKNERGGPSDGGPW